MIVDGNHRAAAEAQRKTLPPLTSFLVEHWREQYVGRELLKQERPYGGPTIGARVAKAIDFARTYGGTMAGVYGKSRIYDEMVINTAKTQTALERIKQRIGMPNGVKIAGNYRTIAQQNLIKQSMAAGTQSGRFSSEFSNIANMARTPFDTFLRSAPLIPFVELEHAGLLTGIGIRFTKGPANKNYLTMDAEVHDSKSYSMHRDMRTVLFVEPWVEIVFGLFIEGKRRNAILRTLHANPDTALKVEGVSRLSDAWHTRQLILSLLSPKDAKYAKAKKKATLSKGAKRNRQRRKRRLRVFSPLHKAQAIGFSHFACSAKKPGGSPTSCPGCQAAGTPGRKAR